MEKKLPDKKKIKIFLVFLTLLFLVLLLRLSYMQIVEGNRYRTLATQNHQRLNPVLAPRGEIVDRNGVRLVMNKPVYTVSLVYLGEPEEQVVNFLSSLLEGDISMKGMTAPQIQSDIQEKIKEHQRLYEPVRIAVDVSQETVNKITEQRIALPGVIIDVEPVRSYPYNDLLGEVVGYVREITGEQLEKYKDQGYQLGDSFGQVGLEYTYESYLRGRNGARQVEVDAQGNPVRDLGYKPPVPGNNLITSIDHRVQRAAQDAVAAAIGQTRNGLADVPPGTPISGTAVVIDVNTGEVIAMASLPSYDLNIFSQPLQAKQYDELLKMGALRNYAIQTTYVPGSVFKMATLASFLENNIVMPETTIYDPGYYKYKRCWKPGGHGNVDAVKSLKISCDTYFYQFGVQAGPDLMGRYAAKFGLGERTGIDLPGEESGRVASKELKAKVWEGNEWESQWREYDSMDMSIGQQETKLTAIQLANFVASIANGGTLYRPHMIKKIVDPNGIDLKVFSPEVIKKVDLSKETLNIIREGMHQVAVGDGTGAAAFWGAPYQVAAKTGTAEVGDSAENAHALYVAYAPYEKPEVAVSVIIEYGSGGGAIAGPVARKILDAYFLAKNNVATNDNQAEQPETNETPNSRTPTNIRPSTNQASYDERVEQPETTGTPPQIEDGSSPTYNEESGETEDQSQGNGNDERQPGITPPPVVTGRQNDYRQGWNSG